MDKSEDDILRGDQCCDGKTRDQECYLSSKDSKRSRSSWPNSKAPEDEATIPLYYSWKQVLFTGTSPTGYDYDVLLHRAQNTLDRQFVVLDCTVTGTCYPRQWFVEITRKKSGAGSLKAFRSWWLSSKASSGSTTTPIPNRSSGPGMSRRLWTRSVVSVVVKPLLRHYNRYFGASFVFSEKMHLNPIIMKMRGVFKRENFSLEFSS